MLWLLLGYKLGRGRAVQARNNPQGIKAKTRLRQAPLTHLLRGFLYARRKKNPRPNKKRWLTKEYCVYFMLQVMMLKY